jgi:hypothetical protein
MFRIVDPRPVAPLSLAEARRMAADPGFAVRFDPATRAVAWAMCLAARRGQKGPVLMLIAIGGAEQPETPEPPKDAA